VCVYERPEVLVQLRHEIDVERQFKGAAAKCFPSVEARGVVEQAVEFLVGYHGRHVDQWVQGEEVRKELFALFFSAIVEELCHDHRRVCGWRCREAPKQRLVSVIRSVELICKSDDVGEFVWWKDEGACEDRMGLWKGTEREGGNNAKVCACTAEGPEEVRVKGAGACQVQGGCEDDFGGEEDVFLMLISIDRKERGEIRYR
jgi:hypothetical protein